MTEKISQKTVCLDNTKIASLIHYRSAEMSDATIILRKEEYLKKKLKTAYEANSLLQKQIKQNEAEIKDERASINFQLSDLIQKELGYKFNCFVEERLERSQFRTNESFNESIQQMMQKYEKIEEECQLLKKIISELEDIAGKYQSHSKGMEELVMSLEVTNREYEDNMENNLNDINEQIKSKIRENENTEINTQNLAKEIDAFVEGAVSLKEEQVKLLGKIEKMKKMALKQQEKVNQIKQWAQIVIDKNNRKLVYKTMNQKREYLQKIKTKNDLLEVYLNQLQAEQWKMIKQEKQNTLEQKKTAKKDITMAKSNISYGKFKK